MFKDTELQDYLETSSSIRTQSAIIAEWNMNIAENILQAGNYRFRPKDPQPASENDTDYRTVASSFNTDDYYFDGQGFVGPRFYTDATDSDITIDGGYQSIKNGPNVDKVPTVFQSKKEKEKLLFSLEDCFGRFRPRSGINKARWFESGKFLHIVDKDMAKRPRYYVADKEDNFKYWSSYRVEDQVERGISKRFIDKLNVASIIGNGTQAVYTTSQDHGLQVADVVTVSGVTPIEFNVENATITNILSTNTFVINSSVTATYVSGGILDKTLDNYYIEDAAPYVVYKEPVPANRIVVKMQTNVGTMPLPESFENINGLNGDPFSGYENQTTPVRWKIQYLDGDNWSDAIAFTENSVNRLGQSIIGPDGYVEIAYGLIVPDQYREIFYLSGEYTSIGLPSAQGLQDGTAFLVKESDQDAGIFYVALAGVYETFPAAYGWALEEPEVGRLTNYVTDLTSPDTFFNLSDSNSAYREFSYVSGLRVVVETMNKLDSTFDLIELSPRLVVDLSGKTQSLSVTKSASDLGISGMPVGQLLASTGSIDLFDYDQAFFSENTNSIVAKYTSQNIQFKIYDVIVDLNGADYYVPIKTMYSEGFPAITSSNRRVSLQLRDMFFRLESLTAPQVFIQNASISYTISLLLDNIGFSNYTFKRVANEKEMVIPFFSVAPDTSIAQVLNDIAVSSQSAMFFDEYNNFVVMSKEYMLPELGARETDIDTTLYGSKDFANTDVTETSPSATTTIMQNRTTKPKLANIIDISAQDTSVYNDGSINYTTRYIQKSYATIAQASFLDKDRTWVYKPSLLWEVSGDEVTKSENEVVSTKSDYALAAIPLNSDLTAEVPSVSGHQVINNVIDFGDAVYWLTRYNGYFYANGEIIRYDAIQYSVSGLSSTENSDGNTVWITSLQEYQRHFAKISFNGKMYPTGLVRIFSEPNYEVIQGVTRLKDGPVAKHGRTQFGTGVRDSDGNVSPVKHNSGLSTEWSSEANLKGCLMDSRYLFGSNVDVVLTGVFSETITRNVGISIADTKVSTETRITISAEPAIFVSKSHGLYEGNKVKLETTGTLPTGFVVDTAYYVKDVLDVDRFTLSNTEGGTAIIASGSSSGEHSFAIILDTLTSYPAVVYAYSHRFLANDEIKFLTTGTLPVGVAADTVYYVMQAGLTTDRFYISENPEPLNVGDPAQEPIEITASGSGTHTLIANITEQQANSTIVVPSASTINVGFTVSVVSGNGSLAANTKVTAVDLARNTITISPAAIIPMQKDINDQVTGNPIVHSINVVDKVLARQAPAGIDNERAKTTIRNGVIKNFMSNTYIEESNENKTLSTQSGTLQASALIMQGSGTVSADPSPNFVSYVHKKLDDRFVHFGTRMRIVGRIENNDTSGQTPNGLTTYYTASSLTSDQPAAIGGASGGIGVFINPDTNNGYYFEIAALTANNLTNYDKANNLHNVLFYKVMANDSATDPAAPAIPIKLWGGQANVIVDSGLFTSQNRMSAEDEQTVYDLSVEYKKFGDRIRFYLFINGVQIATVDDDSPLDIYNNMALFVRGSSRVMFENVYALTNNYTQNTTFSIGKLEDGAFGNVEEISADTALRKYAISGMIQSTYLSGISSLEPPKYNIYFEEFGTIMREAAYFDIRYDKAYPALYAQLAPTYNQIKAYTVSGFTASAYGAEFLVFNNTDSALSLDSTSGNYLRILGITFTQESENQLTVDRYYSKASDFSNPQFAGDRIIKSPKKVAQDYNDIKLSRMTNGKKEFSINATYLQTQDDAEEMMSWLTGKIMQPRKSIGVDIFAMSTLQLGDIVNIDYVTENGTNELATADSRFVVYSIDYSKDISGPRMTAYLSEVK